MQFLAKAEENLEKSVVMENGLKLEIWNKSKVIAGDRWKVAVIALVKVPLEKAFSENDDSVPFTLNEAQNILGDSVTFEKKMERFFIDEKEKEEIKNGLVNSLFESVRPYVSRRQFARKLIIRQYSQASRNNAFLWQP